MTTATAEANEPAAPPARAPRADVVAALAAAAATAPLGLLGPGRVLDDWYTLFWAWSLGRAHAAGPTQGRARPLGALLYDLQFGYIGDHPYAWWAMGALLAIASAVLLRRLAAWFVPPPVATAIAVVWVVSPNHATLDSWASGSLAAVSLLLLLGGGLSLLRASAEGRLPVVAIAQLAAAPLVYEATLPTAGLMAFGLPWAALRRDRWRDAIARSAPVALAGLWLVAGSYHLRHDQGWFGFSSTADALLGPGITRWSGPAAVLLPIGALWTILAVVRPLSPLLRDAIDARAAVLARNGLLVAVVGYLAFVRYPINALGVGDRANVVSAVGGAMLWVSLGWALAVRRRALLVLAVPFCLIIGAARVARAADWHNAGVDAQETLDQVLPRFDAEPRQTFLVVGPVPKGHQGIYGFLGTIDPAVQLRRHDLTIRATVIVHPHDWDPVEPERRVYLRPW